MEKFIELNKKYPAWISLLFWPIYGVCFIWINNNIVPKHIIHSAIDDLIPFNEYFLIPYFSWVLLITASLLYFCFTSKEDYLHECFMMYVGIIICFILYFAYPAELQLRVDIVETNWFAHMVKVMQGIDNPTNVCPSIHVFTTMIIGMTVMRANRLRHPHFTHWVIAIQTITIVSSTMFLKQHSIIDVICGMMLAVVMYHITYHTPVHEWLQKKCN